MTPADPRADYCIRARARKARLVATIYANLDTFDRQPLPDAIRASLDDAHNCDFDPADCGMETQTLIAYARAKLQREIVKLVLLYQRAQGEQQDPFRDAGASAIRLAETFRSASPAGLELAVKDARRTFGFDTEAAA